MTMRVRFSILAFAVALPALFALPAFPGEGAASKSGGFSSECVEGKIEADVMKLIAPVRPGKPFLNSWALESFEVHEREIVFIIGKRGRGKRVEVFLSKSDRRKPAFARAGRFDVRYRKERGLAIGKEEEDAIRFIAKAVKANDVTEEEISAAVEKAMEECKALLLAVSGGSGLRPYSIGAFMSLRVFGVPVFVVAILVILIALYALTWWLEKRGQSRMKNEECGIKN